MSREIKFRGLRIDTKEWVYGSLIQITNPHKIENECWATFIHEGPNISETIRVRMETVGEFTGLKDKNGKEIYEGDVLELHAEFERMNNVWDDDDKTTTVHFGSFSVIFNNDLAAFDLKKIDGNVSGWCLGKENESELEVIGNIYEHPHLLK